MQDSGEYVKTWMLCLVTSQLHFSFGQSNWKAMEAGCDLKVLLTVTVLLSSLHLHLRASEIQNTANELLKISSVNGRKVIQDVQNQVFIQHHLVFQLLLLILFFLWSPVFPKTTKV